MIRKICHITIAVISIHLVTAQVDEQLTPIQRKQRTVVTEPQTLYKGFLRSGTAFSYSTIDKSFNVDGERESFPTNIWASSWFLQAFAVYGVTDRLQVEARLPYNVTNIYQSYSQELGGATEAETIKWNASGTGLSDVSVGLAYQLLLESVQHPSLTTFITATLPTGEKNPTNVINDREFKRASGSGEASLDVRMQLRRISYPFSYTTSVSYTYFFGGSKILKPLDTQEKNFKSGNNFSVDGSVNFHLNDWLAVQNTASWFLSGKDVFDGKLQDENSWVLQYFPVLSFQIKRFRFNQAIVVPLMGKSSAADPNYIMILSYVF